ncbi:MAG: hypothetical protein A3D52_00660 [Candidatus Taylorbacteria bacterium RIFCSPHIGHO2_02_FULL_44_36]|uniref:Uncharacterized protein n=1 Tax=Candidatus Taylorbacteria bacterium RIFCSPLOWO2_12_FULL_44_15c TaxID=1802333 RepID=A0A1G2P5H7_9BACT|nr:MAG: hypothetical protein A3D52_00660 [Candidatus Taylorbacteria bacterium RIFCSPHIGHO2_02_FULL_44_36]OHA38714.1 MAG: hypothetical protein A3I97_00870 [Candidatus Taylorbacteria bacterium RIFCSPLOWO2_02_FULL_44_35]OHA43584.1 MAG: hypothetical protein A3G03_02815 [Candidatus Taylorbacteria bacterium RIFCSPLOWO2_12_FULL_44_15c]
MENNSHLTKGWVEMNVKAEFADLKGYLVPNVFQDTEIEAADVVPLLEVLSGKIGRQIVLKMRKPKKGWRISTIIGYVYHRQDEFPLIN